MDKEILDDVRHAVASRINIPLRAYFTARLDEVKENIINCGEEQYKELRGRALELREFIKLLDSVKE